MGFEGQKTGGKEGSGRVFRGERNVECVWTGCVERCGIMGGMWIKMLSVSGKRKGSGAEIDETWGNGGVIHRNFHIVEKVIPERGDVHRAGRAEKQTARAAERPVSENLLRSL